MNRSEFARTKAWGLSADSPIKYPKYTLPEETLGIQTAWLAPYINIPGLIFKVNTSGWYMQTLPYVLLIYSALRCILSFGTLIKKTINLLDNSKKIGLLSSYP